MALQSPQWFEPSPKARKLTADNDDEIHTALVEHEHSDFQTTTQSDSASVKSDAEAPSTEGGQVDYEFMDESRSKPPTVLQHRPVPLKRLLKESVVSVRIPTSTPIPITTASTVSQNVTDDKRIRKFICRYCSKAFSLMNVLKVHERIHTGEKPYVCEICDKAFNQSGSLNRHKNTHMKRTSDNRSYSCHYCPRQFLHSSQLQEHETMEHGLPVSLKTSSPHPLEHSPNGIHDLRTRSTSQVQTALGSSPMCGLSDSLTHASEAAATSTATTPLAKLTTVANMFSKFDPCSTGLLPLPVGLNLLHTMNKPTMKPLATPEQYTKKTLQETELTNTTVTASTQSSAELFQCNLCPEKFVSRTDLETHFGQHILQQIGSPFGNFTPQNPHLNKTTQYLQSSQNTGKTPMEELLLGVLQNPGKLAFPSPNVMVSMADSQNNPCTQPLPGLDPLTSLANAANSSLMPNTATAAALTALSQLFMSAAVNSASVTGSSGPMDNSNLLTETLARPDLRISQKAIATPQISTHLNSTAPLLDPKSFEQLIKSVTSFNSPNVVAHSNSISSAHQTSSARSLVKDSYSTNVEEQGLNLAPVQSTRSFRTAKNLSSTNTVTPAFMSNSTLGSVPPHPFPWLINLNVSPTPSATEVSSQPFVNASATSQNNEFTLSPEIARPRNRLTPSDYRMNSLNGSIFSEPEGTNTVESSTAEGKLPKSMDNGSPKSGSTTRHCDLCDKTFNCSSALRIHYRKHSGERPFKCSHCGAAFSQNGTLKRHLQTCKVAFNRDDAYDGSQCNSSLEQSDGCATHSHTGSFPRAETSESEGSLGQEENRMVGASDRETPPPFSEVGFREFEQSNRSLADKASQYSPSLPVSTDVLERADDRAAHLTTEEKENKHCSSNQSVELLPNYNAAHSLVRLLKSVTLDSSLLHIVLRYLQTTDLLHGCSSCQIYFVDRQMLDLHQKQMHSSSPTAKPFVCGVCGEDQEDSKRFLAHFIQAHAKNDDNNSMASIQTEKKLSEPDLALFNQDSLESDTSPQHCQSDQFALNSNVDVKRSPKTLSVTLSNGYQPSITESDKEANRNGYKEHQLSEVYHAETPGHVRCGSFSEGSVEKLKKPNSILTKI